MNQEGKIECVQLDALVVLKIIQHCQNLVTGQLLGLAVGNVLEVTNCFPFPNRIEDENEAEEGAEYQIEMMRCLREVNVDNNTVGWYSSSFLGSIPNESAVETQFNYQEKIQNSVMIVYDHTKISYGNLSFKAFRLTSSFMKLYQSQKFTRENLKKENLDHKKIFEEIPVKIHNSLLVTALLLQLQESEIIDSDLTQLSISSNAYLEKNLEFLIEKLDELSNEQNKLQYYQRNVQKQQIQQAAWLQKRKAENAVRKENNQELLPEEDPNFKPIPEHSRLESLLITNQMDNYCKSINNFTGNNISKLFLYSTSWKN